MEPQIELMSPADLDQLPVTLIDADEAGDRLDPVTLIDHLTSELARRVLVVQAAVRQLPAESEGVEAALTDLRRAGAGMVTAGRDAAVRPSTLVELYLRLHRRLSQLEELVWREVRRAVRSAEEKGEIR